MLDEIITVIVNCAERVMLSALIMLIMVFLPIAWSTMLWCNGDALTQVVAVMLFCGSVFFIYCFLRLMWFDIPLTDSSSLVL